MLDFSVKDLGIVPLYACNLNCDFCLFSHHRFEKNILFSIEFLKNYQEEGTITFSKKRIELIAKWLNNSSKFTLEEYSECKK
jgi:molybdenum cofactor biosynthesis enzyme MoaA